MAPKKKRKLYQPSHSHSTSICLQEEMAALFNKKFSLRTRSDSWKFPNSSVLFRDKPFVLANMLAMKDKLNKTKSLLNDYDIKEWHQHTRKTNKAGLVVRQLRNTVYPEMCTQAWAKFHEIINTYDLIPEKVSLAKCFNSVHLCEAPGAFISSLNHYLKSHHAGLTWEWVATTLSPYFEGHDLRAMLDDDRFILETLQHWNFGKDTTGDLMSSENLDDLKTRCQALGPIHLVTADGSIDCADQPAEQERVVAQLIYCEAVTAMMVLSKGGNFVFKMFTALEHQMICLLFLLSCTFSEVSVIKPGTSKSGNSEVYVACHGFKSLEVLPDDYRAKLVWAFHAESPVNSMFPLSEIPENFTSRLWDCEQYFINLQMDAILANIKNYEHMSHSQRQSLGQLRHLVAIDYIDRFFVVAIKKEDHLTQTLYLDGTQLSYTRGSASDVRIAESFTGRHHTGSYNERQLKLHSDWLQGATSAVFAPDMSQPLSLEGLAQGKNGEQLIPLFPDQVEWLQLACTLLTEETVKLWHLLTGRTIAKVKNSRFCTPSYVTDLVESRRNVNILRPDNSLALHKISHQISPFNLAHDQSCTEREVAVLETLVSFLDTNCGTAINVGTSSSGIELFVKKQSVNVDLVQYPAVDCTCELSSSKLVFGNIQLSNNVVDGDSSNSDVDSLGSEELRTKQELLEQLIAALKLLRAGGTFVCQVFELLTRFTAGLVFILHHLFEKVAIVKPFVSRLWGPERFLVCKGFQGCKEHVLSFLATLHSRMIEASTSSDGSEDVLEVVPMKRLYEQTFYKFLKRSNEQLAHLQLQSIIRLENLFKHPECSPSEEDIQKLQQEVKDI